MNTLSSFCLGTVLMMPLLAASSPTVAMPSRWVESGSDSVLWPQASSAEGLLLGQSSSLTAGSYFFETGRLRSEDRLRLQRPPAGVPQPRSQSEGWQFIVFKAGQFSFWAPPGVLSEDQVTLPTAVGSVEFRTLTINTPDRRYVVAYAPGLTEQQVRSPQQILKAIRERVAPADQFQLTEDRAITLETYPGRQLAFTGKEESLIFRAYLVGNRAYVLGVIYPNGKADARPTRAFLNGFQLLNQS